MELCLPKMKSCFYIKFKLDYSLKIKQFLNLKNNKMHFKQEGNQIKILGTYF